MMKKIFSFAVIALIGLTIVAPFFVLAKTNLEINFFYSETCPHCKAENAFFDKIQPNYPDVKINRYLITDTEHRQLLIDSLKAHNGDKYLGLVPMTFIGEDFIPGFNDEAGTGQEIIKSIERQIANPKDKTDDNKSIVKLPIIGTIDLTKYSLLMQAIILGFFDGFNVCSLGALVMILGLVLILKSRPRIILFGGLYILITSLVYGGLIFLWYQLFYYLSPVLQVMNLFVGILGILGAIYFTKQFLKSKKKELVCEQDNKIITRQSQKIREAFKKSGGVWGLIVGVIIFSAVITIVEFPCSAVIPVLFAGVMAHAGLSLPSYILHLLVYLLFYMLDEIVVFLIAVFTMNVKIVSGKTMKYLSLVEAVVLLAMGIYYLSGIF